MIVTDGDRVLQIITNLLSNAFRWTPDGGRVDLALSATERQRLRRRRRHRPGDPPVGARADLPARSGRATAAAPASASRSRASSRGARRPDRARELGRAGQPLRAGAADARPDSLRRVVAAPELVELPRRRSPLRAAFVALRPRQWTKNLLVFAGLVFAAKLGDAVRWLEALRLLRRLLRDLERRVPRQRRARPARRPAAPGQALAADRARRALAARARSRSPAPWRCWRRCSSRRSGLGFGAARARLRRAPGRRTRCG